MRNAKAVLLRRLFDWRPGLLAFLLSAALLGRPALAQNIYSSSGSFAAYVLYPDGNLYGWGTDQYNHPVVTAAAAQDSTPVLIAPPSGVAGWKSVAVGNLHTVAIGTDGNVYAWGINTTGELGDGTTTNSNVPVKVILPSGVTATAVAAGWSYSLALGSDGHVYAWGANVYGQLGDSTTTTSYTPVMVKLPAGFTPVSIFAGWFYSAAIGSDGSLYMWGTNSYGQLGQGNTKNQLVPALVPFPAGVTKWDSVYCGLYFSVALGNDGNLYETGANTFGQLGNGTTTSSTTFIKANKPAGVTSWKTAACVGSGVLAIADNDTLYGWGYGGSGEMGDGIGGTPGATNKVPVETLLPPGVTAKAISGGRFSVVAVGSDNYFYTWGQGTQGQLGDDSLKSSYLPVRVYGLLQTPPAVPTLTSPANNAVNQPIKLTLTWSSSTSEQGYQCQVSTDPTFATGIVANDSGLTVLADTMNSLGYSTKYYWHARSYDNGVLGQYSTVDSFTTIMLAPGATALVSPANNAINRPATDTLKCSTAPGAAQYHWQVAAEPGFSTFVVNDSTNDTMNVVKGLKPGAKYYWQVQAVNPGGASAFAGPDSFTVEEVPASPTAVAPANGATFQRADTLALVWHSVPLASGYGVQVSDSISFKTFVVNDSTADTSQVITKLNNLQKYYWRVLAYNAGGASAYSTIDSFTTRVAVPASPGLVFPKLSTTGIPRALTFTWSPSVRAEKYLVQVATNSQSYYSGDSAGYFQQAIFDTTVSDTAVQLPVALLQNTIYYWHVAAIDTAGMGGFSTTWEFKTGTGLTAVEGAAGIPKTFALLQNYPNPFNPTTMIKYSLPKAQMVTLEVYNVLGQKVATLVDAHQNAGFYEVNFNADRLASGVYLYVLRTGSFSAVHKMLLLK